MSASLTRGHNAPDQTTSCSSFSTRLAQMTITESSCLEEQMEKKVGLTLTLPPRNATEAFFKGSDAATPSPMTFVSSLFADQDPYAGDIKSFSQLLAGAMASPTTSYLFGDGLITPTGLPSTSDSNVNGDGDSAEFKSMLPPRLPIPWSPLLTIPPGLSPTTLLDSPNLLAMGLADPSATTGTFFFPPLFHDAGFLGTGMSGSCKKDGSLGQDGSPTFSFTAHLQLPKSPLASMGPYGLSHQEALARVHAEAHSQLFVRSSGSETYAFECVSTVPSLGRPVSDGPKELPHSVSAGEQGEENTKEMSLSSEDVVPSHPLPHLIEKPSEDGYNWRKYGQKQVKGGKYPRSYYKCTHPGCPVRKVVERSYDGTITEILYKREHNHAKPQSTRRPATSNARVVDGLGRDSAQLQPLERSTASLEINEADNDKCQLAGRISGTQPEPSLHSVSDDEADDGGDDDSGSKRIKLETANEPLVNPPLMTVRESRVVVQTRSEIDNLDDGYRWRKYGRKVVKGNAYPRSYYKCTYAGCSVKKQVERSSTDLKSVITTYEGKHNHGVPQKRNGSIQEASGPPVVAVSSPSQQPTRHVLHGSASEGGEGKGAISLQEQVFGKLFADGHDVGTNCGDGWSNAVMHKVSMDE